MFTERFLKCHVAAASLRTEELTKDERFPVLAAKLVLEPLTCDLAKQLGPSIAEHCFTKAGKIREEMTRVQVRLRDKPQIVTVQMAADATEIAAALRHVRVPMLTITKRELEPEQGSKQTKRVAPQAATLRVTISLLVDPAEQVHREFFCRHIHNWLLFSFDPEEKDLFAELRAADGADEGDAEDEPHGLPIDDDAGDVLDDQKALDEKEAQPARLAKGSKRADGPVH